ncbi:MAG: hypothetical protein ABH860_01185 [bacterium]
MSFVIPCYALSINIDPSNIKVVLRSKETKTGEILVQNLGGTRLKMKAYTEDWIYAPDGSKVFMKPGSSVYSCSSWIKLDPEDFELSPKEDKKVKYTIIAPENVSGGHVSVMFFEALTERLEGIAVSGRIGSIVYQDTEGDIKRSGEIKDLFVIASAEGDPVSVNFSFNNNGNTHISSKPIIKILDGDRPIVEKNLMNLNALPGDTKTSVITIDELLKEGRYKAQVELSFDNKTLKSQVDFTIKKSSQTGK